MNFRNKSKGIKMEQESKERLKDWLYWHFNSVLPNYKQNKREDKFTT